MTIEISSYEQFSNHLQREGIGLTAAELHGLLTGLIAGAVPEDEWLTLLYQFTNNDHAYPTQLLNETQQIYRDIQEKLADIDGFNFELWLPENDDVFQRADAVSEWANHFLLGLGLARPTFEQEINDPELQEALGDLQHICLLGYESDDDPDELGNALEEIIEYIRTIATLFFAHFAQFKPQAKPKLLH